MPARTGDNLLTFLVARRILTLIFFLERDSQGFHTSARVAADHDYGPDTLRPRSALPAVRDPETRAENLYMRIQVSKRRGSEVLGCRPGLTREYLRRLIMPEKYDDIRILSRSGGRFCLSHLPASIVRKDETNLA